LFKEAIVRQFKLRSNEKLSSLSHLFLLVEFLPLTEDLT